ncbi:methyltransferase domain-containing protein [Pelagibacteraceae bacterium]|nr:methyltransferase domain-containing protein [Pelagibacteraceae bacterium]
MAISKKIKRLHDKIYYDEKTIKQTKESFKYFIKLLNKNDLNSEIKILDIGCGNGNLIYYLNKKLPKAKITAIDIDKKLLSIVKKNTSKNNTILHKDINKKFTKIIDKFDIIIAAGVMAIFDDTDKFFYNIKKNLKNNGRIFLFGNFTKNPLNIYIKYEELSKLPNVLQSGFNVYSINHIKKKFNNKKISIYPFFINKNIKKDTSDLLRSWTENYKGQKYFINGLDFYQKQMWIKIEN